MLQISNVALITDKLKMATENNEIKIGCIVSHTAHVFGVKKLICNVLFKIKIP